MHADPSASCAPSYARRSLHTHGDKERCKTNDDQSGRPGGEPGAADAAQCCKEDRKRLTATGILSIVSYDSFTATLETPGGTLAIGGEGLTVSELSVQTGEVKINGSIEYVQYTAKREKQESLFKRLVR